MPTSLTSTFRFLLLVIESVKKAVDYVLVETIKLQITLLRPIASDFFVYMSVAQADRETKKNEIGID